MRGGCLCGHVRYSVATDPQLVAVCHCRDCQRQSGSAFSLVAAIPRASLKLHGTAEKFHGTADSGRAVVRTICPHCGSPLASELAGAMNLKWVKAGTLGDISKLHPMIQIFCDSAQPWIRLEGLKRFARMMPDPSEQPGTQEYQHPRAAHQL